MNVINVGRKKLDIFFILISFFMIILTFMIIYIKKSDRDMKNYTIYHKQIKELSILDQQFENTFLKKYRYIDYDELQTINNQFEEILNFLDHQKFVYKFDQKLKDEIAKLYEVYEIKSELLQQFKSLNARLTNSLHYLYDIHKSISDDQNISNQEKHLFLEIFFHIEQLAMDIPLDIKTLQNAIQKIQPLQEKSEDYQYFYQHAKLFTQDNAHLANLLAQSKQLNLAQQIKHVSDELNFHSQQMYDDQYQISLIFFIFGFLNLVFLIVNYKKINKLVQDLFTFKYTIENSDNLIIITDKNRNIEYVNEAFERKLGYDKEEVIGQPPNIIKSDLMSKQFYDNLNKTLDRGGKWEGEIINKRKDGSLIYEKASIIPILNKDKIQGFLSIKLDISEYINQNNQLKQLHALFEYTQDGILILDHNREIILANPSFLAMSNYTLEDIRKKPLSMVMSDEDKNLLNDEIKAIIQKDTIYTTHALLLTNNQKLLNKQITIIAIHDSNNLVNYLIIYRD
ncbi:MAG: PAS domain S-box protein [Campylobacterota bacterium]|nr:PAS domain S-box protein [Campylobacterota bacterium]